MADPKLPKWYGNDPRLPEDPPGPDRRAEALDSIEDQLDQAGQYDPADRRAKAMEMVRSAEPDSLQKVTLKKDDYVYAFASRPTPEQAAERNSEFGKKDSSPFFMTETEFKKALTCKTADGELDSAQIRSRYALSGDNQCNQVIRRRVTEDHEAWTSTCGPMSELVPARDGQGRMTVGERSVPGGGAQVFCMNNKLDKMEEVQHGLELAPQKTGAEPMVGADRAKTEAAPEHTHDDAKER